MAKKAFPLSRVYQLLEPGPVVLLTTAHHGKPNVMPMSWLTMMDFVPPLVGLIVSNQNFSFTALKATKECAINIPQSDLARAVVGSGNTSGRTIDKFSKFKLTAMKASQVHAPLIAECFASLECKVIDQSMARKYNLFVVKVLKAWVDPQVVNPRTLHHRGFGQFMVAGRPMKMNSRRA